MKRLSLLVCAGVVIGALTSCAVTEDAPPTAASEAPAVTPEAAQDAEPEQDTEAEDDAELDDETEAEHPTSEADPVSCLHGVWLADNAFFLEKLKEYGDVIHDVTGQVLVRFDADGTITTDYQNWTIMAGAEGVDLQIIRAGVDTGTYSTTGGTVDLTDTDVGSTLTLKRGELEMNIPPQPVGYTGVTYSCSAQAAEIHTVDGELQLTRQ